jgi:hypothetical protein
MRMKLALMVAAFQLLPTLGAAQDDSWQMVVGLRSSALATAGWELASSSTLKIEGRPGFGIVTFWTAYLPRNTGESGTYAATARCFDWFDDSAQAVGGTCSQPGGGLGG